MAENWHVRRNNQQYGPYSFEVLRGLALERRILPDDLVWSEKTGGWIRASQIPGLFPAPAAMGKSPSGSAAGGASPRRRPLRRIIVLSAVILTMLVAALSFWPGGATLEDEMRQLEIEAYFAAKFYELANLQTAKVLNSGPQDVSYQAWKSGLDEAIALWEEAEKSAIALEHRSDKIIEMSEKSQAAAILPSSWPAPAYAYTSQEIAAIYDAGPKGQKLKHLARQLGVSAQRALAELKTANSQIEAAGWNDLEKVEETCHNRLTAIKDASKVTVYTGGLILSGGAASAFQAANMVVGGADLVLEVGADVSAIAFGDNETATLLNDIRTLTEPAAALMGIADLAKLKDNLSKLSQYKNIFKDIDKIDDLRSAKALKDIFSKKIDLTKLDIGNSIVYAMDQYNSFVGPTVDAKDRKILGLNIVQTKAQIESMRSNSIKPELKVMSPQEVDKIMGVSDSPPPIPLPLKLLDVPLTSPPENSGGPTAGANPSGIAENNPEQSLEIWQEINGRWLSAGFKGSDGSITVIDDPDKMGVMVWTFSSDGRCERSTAGKLGFIGTFSFQNGQGVADIAHPYEPENVTRISLEQDGRYLIITNQVYIKE